MSDLLSQGADLAEDARRLLADLDRSVPGAAQASCECRPPIDVLETAIAVYVVVDLPGMTADSLRVSVRRETVLVVGAKLSAPAEPGTRFHLAERSYGRFARAVRLNGSVDATRARASITAGQLCVTLPRQDDRRGRAFDVPIEIERDDA